MGSPGHHIGPGSKGLDLGTSVGSGPGPSPIILPTPSFVTQCYVQMEGGKRSLAHSRASGGRVPLLRAFPWGRDNSLGLRSSQHPWYTDGPQHPALQGGPKGVRGWGHLQCVASGSGEGLLLTQERPLLTACTRNCATQEQWSPRTPCLGFSPHVRSSPKPRSSSNCTPFGPSCQRSHPLWVTFFYASQFELPIPGSLSVFQGSACFQRGEP